MRKTLNIDGDLHNRLALEVAKRRVNGDHALRIQVAAEQAIQNWIETPAKPKPRRKQCQR